MWPVQSSIALKLQTIVLYFKYISFDCVLFSTAKRWVNLNYYLQVRGISRVGMKTLALQFSVLDRTLPNFFLFFFYLPTSSVSYFHLKVCGDPIDHGATTLVP